MCEHLTVAILHAHHMMTTGAKLMFCSHQIELHELSCATVSRRVHLTGTKPVRITHPHLSMVQCVCD